MTNCKIGKEKMKSILTLSTLMLAAIFSLEGEEFPLDKPARAVYSKAGQSVSQETLNGVPVLRFALDPAKKDWGEFYWTEGKALPPFQTVKVFVHLRKGDGEVPSKMRLRISDKKSEVFQFSPKEPLEFDADGKCTAVYEIGADRKQKSFWGGDGNGIIDQPCRIQGMSASFPAKGEKCELLITGITWETKGAAPAKDAAAASR